MPLAQSLVLTGRDDPCGRYSDRPWFCVWAKPNQERLAEQSLRENGFPAFLPRHLVRLANRQTRIEPLFPRYLFGQPNDEGEWVSMLYRRGVFAVLRNPFGAPHVVPPAVIDSLQAQSVDGVIMPPEAPELRRSQVGRVTDGPFADFSGLCTRTSADRVWLLLSMLGRPTELSFSRMDVEAG